MRGGKRDGAGRKKGSVTQATVYRQEMLAKAASEGLSPLEFMLNVLRNDGAKFEDRFEAAKAAAPYVHPRLAAVEHSGNQDKPVAYSIVSGVEREAADEVVNGHGDSRTDH